MFKKGDILQHKSNKDTFRKILGLKDYGEIKAYKVMPLNEKMESKLPETTGGMSLSCDYINEKYKLYKKSFFKVRRLQ